MENNLKARKKKDNLLVSLVYLSAIITVGLLVVIVGFIFIKGIAKISPNFLFADYSASGNGGILPMIMTTVYSSTTNRNFGSSILTRICKTRKTC